MHQEKAAGGRDGEIGRREFTRFGVLGLGLLTWGAIPVRSPGPATTAGAMTADTADAEVTLRLPAPTGPHRIGVTTMYLLDTTRTDPWDTAIGVREVMVTVFYPARTVSGRPRAPQMTPGAGAVFGQLLPLLHPGAPAAGVDWAATVTHAHLCAPALPGRWPVLLYSPGGGDPRTLGTHLAEDFASHGHVVVTIDHSGDAAAVEFPAPRTGRDMVRVSVFRGDPRAEPATFDTMIAARIADIRFVLDSLHRLATGSNPDAGGHPLPAGLDTALDLRRVAAYGHSAGGTAVAQAMDDDPRIRTAANLEGYLNHAPTDPGAASEPFPILRHGTDRPLFLYGSEDFVQRAEINQSWRGLSVRPGGSIRQRLLPRAGHWAFTDWAVFAPQLEAGGLMPARTRADLVGELGPARSVAAVRHQLRAFFAAHLTSY